MTRLARGRRLWLASAIAVLTALAGGLHGTRAAFTTSETFTVDVSTGNVALAREGDGLRFDSSPLAPGDAVTATVRLRTSGTLATELALTRTTVGSTSPAGCDVRDALHVRIVTDADGDASTTTDQQELADGPLTELGEALPAGTLPAGGARTFAVTVTFAAQHGATAADNDNCFQGSVATERFGWQALEARP